MKKTGNIDKLLNIDFINKVIFQKRKLNPPTFNAQFRDKVKKNLIKYGSIKTKRLLAPLLEITNQYI